MQICFLCFFFLVMWANVLLSPICSERRGLSTSCSGAIKSDGWTQFTGTCLHTSAPVRLRETNKISVPIETKESYPSPKSCLRGVLVCFCSVCVRPCGPVIKRLSGTQRGPPTNAATSSCIQENRRQLFSSSFICLCCIRRQPACCPRLILRPTWVIHCSFHWIKAKLQKISPLRWSDRKYSHLQPV